jgi:hypothetical protein
MRILKIHLWTEMTAITPRTACEASHSSRNHCTKRKLQPTSLNPKLTHKELEEGDHPDYGAKVRNGGHRGTKLVRVRVQLILPSASTITRKSNTIVDSRKDQGRPR